VSPIAELLLAVCGTIADRDDYDANANWKKAALNFRSGSIARAAACKANRRLPRHPGGRSSIRGGKARKLGSEGRTMRLKTVT